MEWVELALSVVAGLATTIPLVIKLMVKASADTINYDIDLNVVSDMIDDLCDMSNIINPPAEKAGE